jgi:hypothetical protein
VRTTLDIDDDVLSAAKERARRQNTTAGKVISDLARRALIAAPSSAASGAAGKSRLAFRPFPSRGGVVTNEMIDALRDEDAY